MIIITMKNRIMMNIYGIYCARKLKNPFILEVLTFVALAIILSYFVSVPSVLSNMMNAGGFHNYIFMAFLGTDLLVKSLVVVIGMIAILCMRNITLCAVPMLKERFV